MVNDRNRIGKPFVFLGAGELLYAFWICNIYEWRYIKNNYLGRLCEPTIDIVDHYQLSILVYSGWIIPNQTGLLRHRCKICDFTRFSHWNCSSYVKNVVSIYWMEEQLLNIFESYHTIMHQVRFYLIFLHDFMSNDSGTYEI